MGQLNVTAAPDSIIAAFDTTKGIFTIIFADCKLIKVSIVSDKEYIKEYLGDDLTTGELFVSILKYIQLFGFSQKESYSGIFELINSTLINAYSVKIEATFNDSSTNVYLFEGHSLCAIIFEENTSTIPVEYMYLADNYSNPIIDNQSNNITVNNII